MSDIFETQQDYRNMPEAPDYSGDYWRKRFDHWLKPTQDQVCRNRKSRHPSSSPMVVSACNAGPTSNSTMVSCPIANRLQIRW